ncbi:MAG: sulfatase-like hydrolase/transferase, partial [Sphingomonadales bacterium]
MNSAVLALRNKWRPASPAAREAALLCLVAAATLGVELALVERKYAIVGGGFGQSQPLGGLASIALFALLVTACHGFVLTSLFVAARRLHRRLRAEHLFAVNFAVLVPALACGALAVKYEVLSYFSDAISLQLIRNLGGGSLFDALLFVMGEGALAAGGLVAAAVGYALALRWWARRKSRNPVHPEPVEGRTAQGPTSASAAPALPPARRERFGEAGLRIPGRLLLLAGLLLAAALYFANMRADVRASLGRFNSYQLVDGLLSAATDFDRDGYSLYSEPRDPWPFDSSRYPYALDVPGNGIDEDGIGGDFRIDARAAQAEANAGLGIPALPARRKNLIVVVLESTRFDAVGRSFRGRPITPNISALAAGGSAFPAAYSHVGFTTNSLKSLFSGQLEP